MRNEFSCQWKILKNTPFEKLYISPNPGDAGGSVGSALVSLNNSNKKIYHINNYAYLGKEYSNENIQEVILKKLSINLKFIDMTRKNY